MQPSSSRILVSPKVRNSSNRSFECLNRPKSLTWQNFWCRIRICLRRFSLITIKSIKENPRLRSWAKLPYVKQPYDKLGWLLIPEIALTFCQKPFDSVLSGLLIPMIILIFGFHRSVNFPGEFDGLPQCLSMLVPAWRKSSNAVTHDSVRVLPCKFQVAKPSLTANRELFK